MALTAKQRARLKRLWKGTFFPVGDRWKKPRQHEAAYSTPQKERKAECSTPLSALHQELIDAQNTPWFVASSEEEAEEEERPPHLANGGQSSSSK